MKRAHRIALLAVAALSLLEVFSLAAGSVLLGLGFAERARLERAHVAGERLPGSAGQRELEVPETMAYYAVHPYLGFVADPMSPKSPVRDSYGRFRATDLGFFRRTGQEPPHGARPLRIAVFGGSVAFLFSLGVGDRLEQMLAADAAGRHRDVVVESYAIPGYKQPQQLFALEYLLLMGERFDLVLNLDGFNEIALPLTENLSQGTAMIYPRSWGHLIGMSSAPAVLPLAARLELLREARRVLATALSLPAVRWSSTLALSWHAIDGILAPRIVETEARLAQASVDGGSYAARGPVAEQTTYDAMVADLVSIWERSSLMMKQVCDANRIAYVHVLHPNQYLPNSKPLDEAERKVAYDANKSYRTAVEIGYPRLIAAGAKLSAAGVDFVDLSKAFVDVPEQVYVDDCCHFNRRGNTILAEKLAPKLDAVATAAPPSAS